MAVPRIERERRDLNPQRWRQIRGILHDAIATPVAQRAQWVRQACAADEALRGEVESLLKAHQQAGTFMLEPAVDLRSADRAREAQVSRIGRKIGVYQIVEEIGRGGMATVYRAVRADGQYDKQVALKLVRAGFDTSIELERFRQERQILASLDSPNIARLYDGGTSEDGMPYLIIELIDGTPIDQYCDQHRLGTAQRLDLFRQVCGAAQYAHQRLVIHRDIKPSNILVTTDGVPKLLDFGIAKVLGEAAGTDVTHARAMTPGYASPEQVRGESITTASDIYSLGVVLYRLLAGVSPYPTSAVSSHELARVICDVDPPAPSIAMRDSRGVPGVRRLSGDLDNIVLKALRKDPGRRYLTAEQFSDDIRRFLKGETVLATPDSWHYRTRTFCSRHTAGVLASALMLLAVLVGATATLRQMHFTELALNRALDESRTSDQVMDYLSSLFDAASPERTGGKAIEPRVLIDAGQRQIEAHFADRPALRARMLASLGALYCKIGLTEQCRRDLEQALAIQGVNRDGDSVVRAREQHHLAVAYVSAGRLSEATAMLDRALDVLNAQEPRDNREIAAVMLELGRIYRAEHQADKESASLNAARRLLQDSRGNDTLDSVDVLGALAIAEAEAQHREAATALAATRLAVVQRTLGTDDVRYFDALNDSAEVAQEFDHYADAETWWRLAVAGYLQAYGRGSAKSIDSELSLADVLFRRDKLRESIEWFRQAVSDYRTAGTLGGLGYVGALGGLSQVLWLYGDYPAAEAAAHDAYLASQRMHAATQFDAVSSAFRWGHRLSFIGEARHGVTLLEAPMPGDPSVEMVRRFMRLRLLWLGDAYYRMGADASAAKSYDDAIALFEPVAQARSVTLCMTYEAKGLLLAREGRFDEAVALYRLAIAGYLDNQYLPGGPTIAAAQVELARSLFKLGRKAEARTLLDTAAPIVERELAPTHRVRPGLRQLRTDLRFSRNS